MDLGLMSNERRGRCSFVRALMSEIRLKQSNEGGSNISYLYVS